MSLLTSHNSTPIAPVWSRWLDPRFVQRVIGERMRLSTGWTLDDVRVARVYPGRPSGVGIEFALTLQHASGRRAQGAVYASNATDSAVADARASDVRVTARGPFTLTGLDCCFADAGIRLHTPDRDPRLGQVRRATMAAEIGERLRSATIRTSAPSRVRCELLGYRPGRRLTLAYRGGNAPFVVGKMFHNGLARRTPALHRRVAGELNRQADGKVRVPRVVARWNDLNMVVFEGLRRAADDAAGDARIVAAARVLAALHRIGPGDLKPFAAGDEAAVVQRWLDLAEGLERSTPGMRRLGLWVRRTASRLPSAERRFIHRDFYDAQVLPVEGGWAVLDLDTAAAGDCELDIGNYLAHVIWTAVSSGAPDSDWQSAVQAFLPAYTQAAGSRRRGAAARPDERRLRFYLVSSLLRVGVIHALRSNGRAAAPRLLRIAEELR